MKPMLELLYKDHKNPKMRLGSSPVSWLMTLEVTGLPSCQLLRCSLLTCPEQLPAQPRPHHVKPTCLQPRCPSARAQAWQGDQQTPPREELQQLAFKSQEAEMSSSFCTFRLPFSPAPCHPSCLEQDSPWRLSALLACSSPSPSPPGALSTTKWPEGASPLCNVLSRQAALQDTPRPPTSPCQQ